MLSGYRNSLENILRVLESTGKVLEYRVSNIVGTRKNLDCGYCGGGDLTGALHVLEFCFAPPPHPSSRYLRVYPHVCVFVSVWQKVGVYFPLDVGHVENYGSLSVKLTSVDAVSHSNIVVRDFLLSTNKKQVSNNVCRKFTAALPLSSATCKHLGKK